MKLLKIFLLTFYDPATETLARKAVRERAEDVHCEDYGFGNYRSMLLAIIDLYNMHHEKDYTPVMLSARDVSAKRIYQVADNDAYLGRPIYDEHGNDILLRNELRFPIERAMWLWAISTVASIISKVLYPDNND